MSLTGYPDQYSTGSGVAFQYQTVCYGRDTFAYYDTYPGAALRFMDYLIRLHPGLRKYDVDGSRHMNLTEYRAMREAHDAAPNPNPNPNLNRKLAQVKAKLFARHLTLTLNLRHGDMRVP